MSRNRLSVSYYSFFKACNASDVPTRSASSRTGNVMGKMTAEIDPTRRTVVIRARLRAVTRSICSSVRNPMAVSLKPGIATERPTVSIIPTREAVMPATLNAEALRNSPVRLERPASTSCGIVMEKKTVQMEVTNGTVLPLLPVIRVSSPVEMVSAFRKTFVATITETVWMEATRRTAPILLHQVSLDYLPSMSTFSEACNSDTDYECPNKPTQCIPMKEFCTTETKSCPGGDGHECRDKTRKSSHLFSGKSML